ncbi:MAG: PASTA domain-containing protein [Candidatus Eremiobacteraeota bacterium]|nr:PASTA domain-containing protein [Candidatus Eremiobacteraeota bacterium]
MRRIAADGGSPAAGARPRSQHWFARQDWLFAAALAFFVGVSVWFGRAIQDFFVPPSKTIATPALVGETLSDALGTAGSIHLRASVAERTPSDRYPRDVVMRQDPVAGTQVRPGRSISLVVSGGVQIFAMPDLRYESRRELGLDLSHYKLQLGKVRIVSSEEVPSEAVVAQDPPPLTSVRAGSVVNVDIAKGGPQTIRVPHFVGMDVNEARDVASRDHVRFGQLVWTPFGRYGQPRGTVVSQKPEAGAEIGAFQTVSLQLSAGPREAGYLIRQVHATVTVPQDAAANGKSPVVRVEVHDETGTRNVYNAYAEPKQKLDFNLTVVGTAELDVFANDGLLDSTKLGVEPPMQESQKMGPPPPGSKPGHGASSTSTTDSATTAP